MAKKKTLPPEKQRIERYLTEYTRWLNVLESYHTERFDKNYRQFTAYTSVQGTRAKISDPVAPELVERVIQKLFARDPRFVALARGKNLPVEISDVMQATASYLWTNPEKVQSSGSLRQKLKVAARDFCVTGNMALETYYDAASESPDFRVWPIEDVVFNPSMTLKTSGRYYFRQYVSLEYLQSMAEKTGADGQVESGLFNAAAVARIAQRYSAAPGTSMKSDPTPNQVMRSGSGSLTTYVEDIPLVSCVDRDTLRVCRIADWCEVVQEEVDPLGIGELPYDFAMDIEVPKQPYAYSLLDFLSGVLTAKDLFLNQVIDYGSRSLNPPLFVDPAAPATNKNTLRNAFRVGGIVFASPASAQHAQYPPLPTEGFQLLSYLQQRAEGVTGISPYLAGVPNAENDKTQGTKGGTIALINQAGSPVQDRQQNIEESVIEPVVRKFLKLAGSLMGKDEEKFVFVTGQDPKWVTVTKGLLTGKVKLQDLVAVDLVSQKPQPDPATGAPPVDPATGQPAQGLSGYPAGSEADALALLMVQEGKDPAAEIIFDVDWIVRVETGSMAEQDSVQDVQNFLSYVQFRTENGIPTDYLAISHEMALRMGIKNPEQYDIDPSEAPAPQGPQPSESLNFKDLPPDGQVQMAAQAGIRIAPPQPQPQALAPAS